MVLKQIRTFLLKPQINIVGFIAAMVTGNTTFELLKSFSHNILMPIFAYLFMVNEWEHIKIGNIRIGDFLEELLTWIVIMLVLYVFVEYILEHIILREEDKYLAEYKDKYEENYYENIITGPQGDIMQQLPK